MNTQHIDTLGKKLAEAALTTLVRICPEVRTASTEKLEAACTAMRAQSKWVIDELFADAKAAPGITHIALANAALSLAHEGVRIIRNLK